MPPSYEQPSIQYIDILLQLMHLRDYILYKKLKKIPLQKKQPRQAKRLDAQDMKCQPSSCL